MSAPRPAAFRIDPDGSVNPLPDVAYETIRDAVGGWIEVAPTSGDLTVWVDEDGKTRGLPWNPLGHALWAEFDIDGCVRGGDWMAGPCVVTGPPDRNGDTTPVPEFVSDVIRRLAARIINERTSSNNDDSP